jgi:hypothetical protein
VNNHVVTLGPVRADEKGKHCPGLQLGHPVPGGYKYGDLALQVGSLNWDNNIYLQVLRDCDRAVIDVYCNIQASTLVREGAIH